MKLNWNFWGVAGVIGQILFMGGGGGGGGGMDIFWNHTIQGLIVFVISNRPHAVPSSDFEITRTITPWIVLTRPNYYYYLWISVHVLLFCENQLFTEDRLMRPCQGGVPGRLSEF